MARTLSSWAAVGIVLAAWMAFLLYGLYVGAKLHRRCHYQWPPEGERWNPKYYVPGTESWIRRDRQWERWKWPALIAAILLMNGIHFLFKR